jgi:hypothetical protein
MGANAQTKVPTFASAEVLTAANQNLLSNGIPVFSGTATRNDAFGGSGEKVLAEGQFAYLEDSNTTQYYDGAAWQTVGPTPGLTLISTATIGSAVSSATISSVFSSTYDNYLVTINSFTNSATGSGYNLFRLDAGGTTDYTTRGTYASGTTDTSASSAAARMGVKSTGRQGLVLFLLGPNMAQNTLGWLGGPNGEFPGFYNVFINTSTQYTNFTVLPDSGTITGGTIRVYGFSNS